MQRSVSFRNPYLRLPESRCPKAEVAVYTSLTLHPFEGHVMDSVQRWVKPELPLEPNVSLQFKVCQLRSRQM